MQNRRETEAVALEKNERQTEVNFALYFYSELSLDLLFASALC
jgi:hypothetical protein